MKTPRHDIVQWSVVPLMVIVICLGWYWPVLGFIVPVVMIAAILTGIFRGRYVCGNLCPRGAFYDRVLFRVSKTRSIPAWLFNKKFRWLMVGLLMGFMTFQISRQPDNWQHWGWVFWLMCAITSAIGITLGLFIRARTWCSFCPIGTIQNALGQGKYQLKIDGAKCIMCKRCEKVCPMGLRPYDFKAKGVLTDGDCVRCANCVLACPKKALSF
jgi:ferredoxin-type protein NapH